MSESSRVRRPVVFQGSTNRCFGCGPENPRGLRLEFVETDEGVEVAYEAPAHVEGPPGIIHGGIQGTLLDEAMCMTAYAKRGSPVVTGELTVRYLRPVPSGTPLVIRGRIVAEAGRRVDIEGSIRLQSGGEDLTQARGRFFRGEV